MVITPSARPKMKKVPRIALAHDYFITLLTEKEGAAAIGLKVEQQQVGCRWLHYPMSIKDGQGLGNLHQFVYSFSKILMDEPYDIFVHCAAGRDRTGIFLAALMSANGLTKEQVKDVLGYLRPEILESKWYYLGFPIGEKVYELRGEHGDQVLDRFLMDDLLQPEAWRNL